MPGDTTMPVGTDAVGDDAPAGAVDRPVSTRERLLAAAETLFAELGYSATSPADVTSMAGIGRTTFYEYFTDMGDLLAAMVEERLPAVTAEMVAAVPRDVPYRDQLAELAMRMIEFSVTDHVLGLALHQDLPTLGPVAQQRIAGAHRGISEEFSRIYRSGVAAGELRALPPQLAAGLLRDTILSGAKVLMTGPDPEARLAEVAGETVGFLLRGLDPA